MINVRAYNPADYESLKELYLVGENFGGQFDPDRDSKERIDEQFDRDPESILVAEEDGKMLGTLSILQDRRFAWLMRFAVVESRENEVSESLFEKAEKILKENGHSQVLVYGPLGRAKFIERYERLSFVAGGPYVAFWKTLN